VLRVAKVKGRNMRIWRTVENLYILYVNKLNNYKIK
jgi:hypothetical protein